MRIELPSPSWADVHRAQDDAHTLTLPAQAQALHRVQLPLGETGRTVRVAIAPAQPLAVTITL